MLFFLGLIGLYVIFSIESRQREQFLKNKRDLEERK